MSETRSRSKVGAAVLVAILVLGACGGEGRPDVDTWSARWDEAVASIPPIGRLGTPPEEDLCKSTLAHLREFRNDLFPTPDRAVDEVVSLWIRIGEDAFFECPPASSEIPDLDYAYREMARLEAEVDAALGPDR